MDIGHLPKQSGVYKITNQKNGFVYVGSAGKQGIRKRLLAHVCDLKNNKHHSWILQQDWIKYGEDKFKAEVILVCSPSDGKKVEQEFLNAYGVGRDNKSYNILDKVDHSFLPKTTIEKIKMANRNPNLILSTNRSGYKGVCFFKRDKKWKASIQRYGHSYHIGYYETPEEASVNYQKINSLSDDDFNAWWENEFETKRKGQPWQFGENGNNSKISDAQCKEILDLYATGEYSQLKIGEKYGVHQTTIRNIIIGRRKPSVSR